MEQHELISAEFTRRRFIKGAGAAAVAVGVMGTSTGIASAAKVAAPKKGGTLKLGVVGGAGRGEIGAGDVLGIPRAYYGGREAVRVMLAQTPGANGQRGAIPARSRWR